MIDFTAFIFVTVVVMVVVVVVVVVVLNVASENVLLEEGSLNAILEAANGDMRRAVTILQSCQQLCGGVGWPVTVEVVLDISGKVLTYCSLCFSASVFTDSFTSDSQPNDRRFVDYHCECLSV